jgi:integral membrane protein
MSSLTPRQVFRALAVGEAVTWALLLSGMFLKYVTETTELGVQVFGMVHGVVFLAYCLVTLVVAIDQRWSLVRTVAGLVAAVPPFATLLFEAYADRRGLLGPVWLSRADGSTARERAVCWLLRHHRMAAGMLVVVVAGLTGLALVAGPPA